LWKRSAANTFDGVAELLQRCHEQVAALALDLDNPTLAAAASI